jgi:hypothetical protein
MATHSVTLNPYLFTVPSNVAQVATVTLTGTDGTAEITVAGGLTKTVTFNTDLTTTASDFDTAHSAAYTAVGITVTSSGADIIFTAAVAGVGFDSPVITNLTEDLDGTVVDTTANSSREGELDLSALVGNKNPKAEAEVIYVSGTSVQFSNNATIVTASGALTTTVGRMTIPLLAGKNLKFKGGAGGETFIVISKINAD